jgi:hypothetical protein
MHMNKRNYEWMQILKRSFIQELVQDEVVFQPGPIHALLTCKGDKKRQATFTVTVTNLDDDSVQGVPAGRSGVEMVARENKRSSQQKQPREWKPNFLSGCQASATCDGSKLSLLLLLR